MNNRREREHSLMMIVHYCKPFVWKCEYNYCIDIRYIHRTLLLLLYRLRERHIHTHERKQQNQFNKAREKKKSWAAPLTTTTAWNTHAHRTYSSLATHNNATARKKATHNGCLIKYIYFFPFSISYSILPALRRFIFFRNVFIL